MCVPQSVDVTNKVLKYWRDSTWSLSTFWAPYGVSVLVLPLSFFYELIFSYAVVERRASQRICGMEFMLLQVGVIARRVWIIDGKSGWGARDSTIRQALGYALPS